MEYYTYNNDELTHWGIKGMRWGIRRFQNKDGSLTPAGKKRRAKLEGELEQLGGRKKTDSDADATPRKKTVGEMTDDELREHTNRMRLESEYYNAAKNLATSNPRKVSAGEKFAKSLIDDVVAPAAKSAGRAWLEKFMKDKLGLNDKDPIEKMERKVKQLELTKRMKDLNKDIKKSSEEDPISALEKKHKKLDLEKKIKDLENPERTEDIVSRLNSMTPEQRDQYAQAAGILYYISNIQSGKGVKPDKGDDKNKNKNKDKDDDD